MFLDKGVNVADREAARSWYPGNAVMSTKRLAFKVQYKHVQRNPTTTID